MSKMAESQLDEWELVLEPLNLIGKMERINSTLINPPKLRGRKEKQSNINGRHEVRRKKVKDI